MPRASMDPEEAFGAGGSARDRALLSWAHDSEFDVRLDGGRAAGLGAGEDGRLLYDPSSSSPSTPPRVPAAVHLYAHSRSSSASSVQDTHPFLAPSPPAIADAATPPSPMASSASAPGPSMGAAASASAAPKLMPAPSGSSGGQMQRGDDQYDYHAYSSFTDNSIASHPPAAGAQGHQQQQPPSSFPSLSSSTTLANGSPAASPPSTTAAPPTPPKPGHYIPASSASSPPAASASALRTQSPPRTGSFKAFASSPLAGAGGPSSSPSVSSAPFLVLTSGAHDGSASNPPQRGSTLIDGPRPGSGHGPSSTANNNASAQRHQPNTVPTGGQPTPRLSNSSSSASSIPVQGNGSMSASTSSTAASPPLANATSGSSNSGFVSPFARPGTRPLLVPVAGSMGSLSGLALNGGVSGHQQGALQGSTSGSVGSNNRGSMILYRLSVGEEGVFSPGVNGASGFNAAGVPGGAPPPPGLAHNYSSLRHSGFYSETDSFTLDGDSKYPPFPNGNSTPPGGSGRATLRGSILGFPAPAGPPGSPGAPGGPPIGTSPFTLGMRSSTNELFGLGRAQGGLVAYVYDPDEDDEEDGEDWEEEEGDEKAREEKRREEWVHDPSEVNALYASVGKGKKAPAAAGAPGKLKRPPPAGAAGAGGQQGAHAPRRAPAYQPPPSTAFSARGIVNVTTLVALILALLCLFIVLPVAKALTDDGVQLKILENTRINSTGQAVSRRELAGGRREWRVDFGQER